MLIRFIVENFLSFKEETEFNMLTGDVRRHPNHVYRFANVDLVKSAVIYGANGAGKSNLILAINFLSEIVREGSIDTFDNFAFKLSEDIKPSTLELEFLIDGTGYSYGMTFHNNIIQEEWLYLLNFGKKDDELVFERAVDDQKRTKLTVAPKYLKTQKDRLLMQLYEEDLLEPEVPFISLVKDKKFKEINNAYKWIEKGLVVILPGMQYAGLTYSFINDDDFKLFTNKLICKFDTGIKELDIQNLDFDTYFGEDNKAEKERVLKLIRSGQIERVGDNKNAIAIIEEGKPVIKKVVSYHMAPSGRKVVFELFDESDGTLRLIDFIPVLYMLEKFPVTVMIDEMDQSIHPSLLKEFIGQIQENNNKVGQLIITTHESNLLDLDLFRQDEIWFAEKNKEGATHLYPLSEYNVRPDLDIRKGYLSGRFGAIPFLGDLKKLRFKDYGEE
ncbi:AAA family ATPase [Solitalea lacus]|uniref:AAA family ATPase n=1 Tax=Solitalea lacus TaxID=2911172 RepID=UPI001EDB71FF|nr:ATP-binding protein [Solitalea lacus]UKJ06130.1 ATP-binding protein [Solitalea lacus]